MIEEETVMHKSVAIYTDSSVRRKAKKSECFVENDSLYIPVRKHGCFSKEYHVFKESYTSKDYYVEVNDALMKNKGFFELYFTQIL